MTISVIDIVESTTVDGPGFRTSVYCAGCAHHCPGCHNPETWNFNNGKKIEVDKIAQTLLDNPFENITFSGGDPMYQAEAFASLAKIIKSRSNKTIWCYTGFKFEEIKNVPPYNRLIKYIDVLVDGPYIEKCRNTDLIFRGSENQRLIDVNQSLLTGETIEYIPNTAI